MVAKPTKPTVPDPALRSEPDTFGDRVEANVVFWDTLVTYMSDVTDYTEEQVTALLLGNLPSLSGKAKDIVRVNAGETAVELLATSANVNSILEAADFAAIKTLLAYGTAAAQDFTDNDDLSVDTGNVPTRGNVAAAIADQFNTIIVMGSATTTLYQNTTGKPMLLMAYAIASGGATLSLRIGPDVTVAHTVQTAYVVGSWRQSMAAMLPPGWYYYFEPTGGAISNLTAHGVY